MTNTFNEFEKSTTSIKLANMPKVASAFKSAMLNYQYAANCPWYEALKNSDPLKAFNVFNITFDIDRVNQTFIPVIKDIAIQAGFKDMLKAIAPFMENGSLFFKDDFRYYTISFTDGVVTGKRRTIEDGKPEIKATATAPQKAATTAPKKTTSKGKKEVKKEAKKFNFTAPTIAPVTMKRDDNTYTVAELVRELLKQMDMGNASKRVTIEADFLFQNEATA